MAATGRDGKHALRPDGLEKGGPVGVNLDPRPFVIVEPGTPQALVVEFEGHRFDDVNFLEIYFYHEPIAFFGRFLNVKTIQKLPFHKFLFYLV